MENRVFKKINSFTEVLSKHLSFSGKVVVDIGCGTGDIVRWLAAQGSHVTGLDLPELIEKAQQVNKVGDENYIVGTAQELPFNSNYADLIIFLASFHHVPENHMSTTLEKCYDILKSKGHLVIIEPVLQEDSYYQLTRLVEEEVEIQKKAYYFVKNLSVDKFQSKIEEFYYVERSFQDFVNLINIYVTDKKLNEKILQQAKQVVKNKNEQIETVKFQSRARLNILMKND